MSRRKKGGDGGDVDEQPTKVSSSSSSSSISTKVKKTTKVSSSSTAATKTPTIAEMRVVEFGFLKHGGWSGSLNYKSELVNRPLFEGLVRKAEAEKNVRKLNPILVGKITMEKPAPDEGFAIPFTQGAINPLHEFLSRMRSVPREQPIVVQAGTGTGKSIAIPIGLLQLDMDYRVLVACPTIRAASDLCIAVRIYCKNKFSIGYAADRDIRYNKDTNVVYATAGHIFACLLRNPNYLHQFSHLLLDEFQKPGIEMALIYQIWKRLPVSGPTSRPILLLVSANQLNLDDISSTHIEVDIKTNYKVTLRYHDSDEFDTSIPGRSSIPGNENLYQKIATILQEQHHEIPRGTRFLVFCPGQNEIDQVARSLSAKMGLESYKIYRVVGGEPIDTGIYQDPSEDVREIVLATNAAETSITISRLALMIDSMREKRREDDRIRNGFTTQDNALQRRGRLGRVMEGLAYCMCSQMKSTRLAVSNPSPFVSSPLEKHYLTLLTFGYDPQILFPVSSGVLGKVANNLRTYKLLDTSGKVLPAGEFTSFTPLSYASGAFFFQWLEMGLHPFLGAVIASIISSEGRELFTKERKPPKHIFIEYYKLAGAYVQLLIAERKDTIIRPNHEKYMQFCAEHQLIPFKGFLEFTRTLHDVCNMLRNTPDTPLYVGPLPEYNEFLQHYILTAAIIAGFVPEAGDKILRLGPTMSIKLIKNTNPMIPNPKLVLDIEEFHANPKYHPTPDVESDEDDGPGENLEEE